jgi:hypothetical protein
MNAIQIISQDLFDKVRSRFSNLEMGDQTGAVTIDPSEAKFFDFDFVLEGLNLGRVSISLNDLGSLKVYYSQGITENQDDPAKQEWFKFLREMRLFAMRRLLRFDTRDIAKSNLDKNDFQHLATTQGPKEEDMNTMNESRWSQKSSSKTSRAVAGRTEVIIRHTKPVDEEYAGSRSQRKNIKAIFIQNADGERAKYPFIHPAGAFAMAQHVDHGGVPHDPAGKAIIQMSEQIAQLQEFQRKVHKATLHADATGITERALGRLQELKSTVAALGKKQHYENWVESFQESSMDDGLSMDDVTMEQYKQTFTQTNFQEELAAYFPLLHKIMSETNTINLEDYVNENEEDSDDEEDWHDKDGNLNPKGAYDAGGHYHAERDAKESAFNEFIEWADSVVEGPAVDANAKSPTGSQSPALAHYADQLDHDASVQDDSSDDEDQPDPEKQTQAPKESMIKEVAKLVKSRFNEDNPDVGPFNGAPNIALDVKKSIAEMFGDEAGVHAEQLALEFMEKLSHKWEQKHNKVSPDDGLARLKELLGNVKAKVEGIGDMGAPASNMMPSENKEDGQNEAGPDKSQVPAYKRKEQGGDWKMSTKDLEREKTNSPTSSAGLARKKAELGISEELDSIMRLANHKK